MKIYNHAIFWFVGCMVLMGVYGQSLNGLSPSMILSDPSAYFEHGLQQGAPGNAYVGAAIFGVLVALIWGAWLSEFGQGGYGGFASLEVVRAEFGNVQVRTIGGAGKLGELTTDIGGRPGKFYRINSDGMAVDLRKWTYTPETGEFFRIRRRHEGNITYDTVGYNKRLALWIEGRNKRYVMGFFQGIFMALLLLSLVATGVDTHQGYSGTIPIALTWFSGIVLAILFYKGRHMFNRRRVVGPEPLRVSSSNFGPSTPSSARSRGGDNLGYKPTV